MPTETTTPPTTPARTPIDSDQEGLVASSVTGFRWSAIFAGLAVTLGIWALLYALGLAVGLTAISPQDVGSAQSAGVGTGIWSLIVPLIALFCGGLVASRVAGPIDRTSGAIHGAVLWGVSTIAGMLFLGMLFSTAMSGVANFIGSQGLMGQAQETIQGAVPGAPAQALQAAAPTAKVFWGIFGALLLGLVSAVIGATVGVTRKQRYATSEPLTARRTAGARV